MRRNQRGITFVGWIFLLIPLAVVAYAAIRLAPVYLNYMRVSRSISQVASEAKGDDTTNAQTLRVALDKRLVVAEHLFRAFPECTEGDLSRLRARVVSSEPLAEVAAALGLGDVLKLGSGELKTGGFRRKSILADGLEAICGALFLDGGLDAA